MIIKLVSFTLRQTLIDKLNDINPYNWDFVGIRFVNNICACNQPIKNAYIFRYKNKNILVGKECLKYFPQYQALFQLEKITKNRNNSIKNCYFLNMLFTKQVITLNEYIYYENTKNKTNLTPRQMSYRVYINNNILKYYTINENLEHNSM